MFNMHAPVVGSLPSVYISLYILNIISFLSSQIPLTLQPWNLGAMLNT